MCCSRTTSRESCQPKCRPRGPRMRCGRRRSRRARTRSGCETSADTPAFDICDTTACQVYGGLTRETHNGNAAVKATAGKIVTYRGKVALTQFASSNGGYSAQGDYPYLAAHRDPYDSVIKSQAWTRTISASSISRLWPSVGTVKRLQITSRDGAGSWGGRVKTIKIIGTARTTTVSGTTFQHMFGMRSSLYMIAGSTTTRSPAPRALSRGRGVQANHGVRDFPASLPIRLRSRPVVDQPCRCAAAIPSGEGSSAAPGRDRYKCRSLHPCRQCW